MEKKYDIAVIGGGGSGLVAAARAAELSGKKVVVLEKAKYCGGGMLFASAMRTFRSKWQQERGIPDKTLPYLRRMMDLTLWRLDHELVRDAVLATGEFFDWYAQHEAPEILALYEARPYFMDIPLNGQAGPQLRRGFHNGSGRVMMQSMIRTCHELGVDILLEHRVTDVEMKNGRIIAVIAQSPEENVRISCDTCIIAAGSWINDSEVVDQVMPQFNQCDVLPSAHQNPAYTGDGFRWAKQSHAMIDQDSLCLRIMGPLCGMGDHSKFDALTKDNCIVMVNLNAERFAAEPLVPRMDPFDTGHVLLNYPKGKIYFIYSANLIRRIIYNSNQEPANGRPAAFSAAPLPPFEEVDQWFRDAADGERKEVAVADTIEGLAGEIGLDPQKLRTTIDRYNQSCDTGEDMEFFKDADGLIPLKDGPFYAMSGKLATDGAFGGIRVNKKMQAYREDGSLIDGLYVTGDFASGRHIVLGGIKRQVLNDMSWALASGFIAGTNAAQDATD